jgi:hypothetical protein
MELKDKDEEERYALGVQRFEFDQFLGAYPWGDVKTIQRWRSLTRHISASVVRRLEPIGHKLTSAAKPLTEKELDILQSPFKTLTKQYGTLERDFPRFRQRTDHCLFSAGRSKNHSNQYQMSCSPISLSISRQPPEMAPM